MKRITISIIIVLLLPISKVLCQDFSIKLKLENDVSKQYQKEHTPHIIDDKKILQKFDYKKNALHHITFAQYYFSYTDIYNEYYVDTLNVAIYISEKPRTTVIIDTDKDNNFENDRKYIFDESTSYHEVNLPIQCNKNTEIHNANKSFLLVPIRTKDKMARIEKFKIVQNWVYKGEFKLHNTDGEILFRNLSLFDLKVGRNFSPMHRVGDTILIQDKLYATKGNLNEVFFKDIGDIDYTTLLPATDYLTKKRLNKNDFNGKYILYDFWGSWCVPCIKGIPDLKDLRKRFYNNLEIISIAYENTDDLSKLDKVINENQMSWPQLYYLRKEKDPEKNGSKYFARVFPTFVLIDSHGKVVIRVEGSHRLKEITEILHEKFPPE